MVLRFVFFLRVLVFICMSLSVYFILFCSTIPLKKKKKSYLEGKSDQFHSQKKHNEGEVLIPLTLLAEFSRRRCV